MVGGTVVVGAVVTVVVGGAVVGGFVELVVVGCVVGVLGDVVDGWVEDGDGVVVVAPGKVVVVVVGAVFPFRGGFTAVGAGAVDAVVSIDDEVGASDDEVDSALVIVS